MTIGDAAAVVNSALLALGLYAVKDLNQRIARIEQYFMDRVLQADWNGIERRRNNYAP